MDRQISHREERPLGATPYDDVEYPGRPSEDSHPDHLAALAVLFGMEPAPVERCRILELGCGDGANLLSIALGFPECVCVGFDLAARPIERGRAAAAALDLGNVNLHCRNIADLGPEIGTFDYIIAHGVYSWVPPDIRDAILRICKRNLAPNGVAFVSYNAHPGGHVQELVRQMMLFQVGDIADHQRRVAEGLALIEWVMESTPIDGFRRLLADELAMLKKRAPEVIHHDTLAAVSQPIYFHDFAEHAHRHGLQYLTDAEFSSTQAFRFSPALAELLRRIGNVITKEQLQDFLLCRRFRQTLLCHDHVRLDRAIDPARIRGLWVESAARSASAPDLQSTAAHEFRLAEGRSISTNHPLTKAAMLYLAEQWPRYLSFSELTAAATARLASPSAADGGPSLEEHFLTMFAGGVVELHAAPPPFSVDVAERPIASRLARWQLGSGNFVTTLRHTTIELDDSLLRRLVSLLDGTRDRVAIARDLTDSVVRGEARLERGGRALTERDEVLGVLGQELPVVLSEIARLALLVA